MADRKPEQPNKTAALVTLSAGVLSGAMLAGLALPAAAVTGTGQIEARVFQDFGLLEVQTLDFGSFAPINPTATGALTVQADGSVVGEVNTSQLGTSTPSSGAFRITSVTPGETFVINTTGGGTATIKNTAGTDTMTISSFVIGCNNFNGPTSAPATGVSCTATGAQSTGTFNVGAKLNVNANQVAGSYTGTYSLIVTML